MMKPWLLLPPSVSHKLAPLYLKYVIKEGPFETFRWRPYKWRGHEFSNPLGIAGGVDKDAEFIKNWWTLGAGFVEIGTVTPEPQLGNPGKVLDRDRHNKALWNKMGFPSKGSKFVKEQLKRLESPHHTAVFVNIGKNRITPLEEAAADYVHCIEDLHLYADAFVVNISSPNTPKLRELLCPENLKSFLQPVVKANNNHGGKPLILKVSPDVEDKDLENILSVSVEMDLDGWIISNTTLSRPQGVDFPEDGGLSGLPLGELAKSKLKQTLALLGKNKEDRLLISTGGIMSAEDVFERLDLGADLVQVYSSLIFNGLNFFKDVNEYAQRK